MVRFVVVFIALISVLFGLEMLNSVQDTVVQPFTSAIARVSAWFVQPFDDAVISSGRVLRHAGNGFAVSIESGCNGVEAMIVLFAAIIAFPGGWYHRLLALMVGFVAVQAMNILRIISLFYLGQWNLDVFTWMHLYLWPVLIMLDVLIVFLVYLRWLNRPQMAEA